MRFYYLGQIVRWVGWATIWMYMHPDMYTWSVWQNTPVHIVGLITLYFISGWILEFTFRKIAWRGNRQDQDMPQTNAPICPNNPWISFFDTGPPEHSDIEVYCVDGVARKAKTKDRIDGRLQFQIHYEPEVLQQQKANPLEFCPTHWRKL